MPNVEAAEDLNLGPLATVSAALGNRTLLHAPHQPPNLTFGELIVSSVGYRQPEQSKPVGPAKVVQEVGQFGPKELENRMLRDVGTVFIGRLGVPIALPRVAKPLLCVSPPSKTGVIRWGICALLQILHWSVSAKLPLVFRLLDTSKRREVTRTDPPLLRHVGTAKPKAQ